MGLSILLMSLIPFNLLIVDNVDDKLDFESN